MAINKRLSSPLRQTALCNTSSTSTSGNSDNAVVDRKSSSSLSRRRPRQHDQQQQRPKKHVTIDETMNKFYDNISVASSWIQQQQQQDCSLTNRWCTVEDYHMYRDEHRELITQISRRESLMQARCPNSYKNVLLRINNQHKQQQECSFSMDNDEEESSPCSHNSSSSNNNSNRHDFDLLVRFMQKSPHGRIGLETKCASELAADKAARRGELHSIAVAHNINLGNDDDVDDDYDDDIMIGTLCRNVSRPACQLAHQLALALEASLLYQ